MYSGVGANLSLDYSINKNNTIGFIYDVGKVDHNMDIDNKTGYESLSVLDSILTTVSKHRNPTFTQTLNAYYDTKLDDKGKKISFIANYFENLPETTVNFNTTSNVNLSTNNIVRNKSDINYNIWSVQSDLNIPTKFINIEVGTKYTKFNNESDVKYFDFIANNYVINQNRSNVFDYDEQNIAGYLSVSKDLKKGWSFKSGLRYEYSIIEGFTKTTGVRNKNKYGNWFPSFYLSYKPNNKHFYTFNYSKRINRPSFKALNPFRWYSNPYTYYTGNPVLQPSFNHNIEFSYSYKHIFSARFYNQYLTDGYGRTFTLLNNTERVVDYANYLTKNNIGFSGSLFLSFFNRWSNYINVNASYSSSQSSLLNILPQKGYSLYYSSNNSFTINKEKQINLLANFWHSLPARSENTKSESISSLSLGIRFPLVKNKIQVNLIANDVFKSTVSKGQIFFSDFTQFYNNYYDGKRFTLSLTYNFGNRNVHGNNKRINFNEKYRGN